MSKIIGGATAFAAVIIILIIVLVVVHLTMPKDCDCAEEGGDCKILNKPYSIKYMDVNDPSKFKEKKFGIGGDYVIYPLSLKCDMSTFSSDPSPGNKKKCTLTRGKLSIC